LMAIRGRSGGFQSTPPCGGRPDLKAGTWTGITVSIHAPVRGATLTEAERAKVM